MVRAVGAACFVALLFACADADPPLRAAVCDETRPCGLGARCVAGFCVPPTPDAARFDLGPDGFGPIDPDAAEPEPPPDRGVVDARVIDRGPDRGVPTDGGSDAADLSPPDMDPPDEGLPGDCGRFGQACCAGDVCRDGGCLDGTCAAFGGVYAFGGLDGACTAGNPLNRNRCQCPPGFTDHPLEDVDFDESEGLGIYHSVYICAPENDDPAADLRGAYAVASDPEGAGCPNGCRLGPLQPACGCPDGTTALTFEGVRQQLRGIDRCPRAITLCGGDTSLTYGGAYRLWRPQTVACNEIQGAALCVPNPRTGDCSCPAGFAGASIGMMAPHPTRGAPFYCRSDVVVCGARPAQ